MPVKVSFSKSKQIKKITQLFFKKGYHATSMQDIVDATNLNRSSIYNTFGSKLELFVECFEKSEANYRKEIQNAILSSANPVKSLTEILELSVKKVINGKLTPNYISELKNEEPAIQKLISKQHEYMMDLFLNIVKRGQNLGSINNSKSEKQYAMYLLNAYQGLKVVNHLSKNDNDLKNVIQNTISLLE